MVTKNYQRGVTLTELSVSVTIISLLIAGTFGGLGLLKAAKIRKLATELTSYMGAVNEFQSHYGYLPGDLPTASTEWSGAHNGNGDGYVTPSASEDLYAWEHLSKDKLISGTYTGTGAAYLSGVNAPNSDPFNAGVFSFFTYTGQIYNTTGQALALGSIVGGLPIGGVMTAKDAYSIDVKIDDGLASSGMFYTVQDNTATGCTTAAKSTASANYVLSDNTNVTCELIYWQKKF